MSGIILLSIMFLALILMSVKAVKIFYYFRSDIE